MFEHCNSWNRETSRWDFKKKVNLTGERSGELEYWSTAGKDQWKLKNMARRNSSTNILNNWNWRREK